MSHATQSKTKIPVSQFETLKKAFTSLGYEYNPEAKFARIYGGRTHKADLGIFSHVRVPSDVAVVYDKENSNRLDLVSDRMYQNDLLGEEDCILMEAYSKITVREYADLMGGTVVSSVVETVDGQKLLVQEVEIPDDAQPVGQSLI